MSLRSRLKSDVVWPPISFLTRPMYLSMLAGLLSSTSLIVSRLGAQLRLSPQDPRKENFEISRCRLTPWQCSQLGCVSGDAVRTSTEVIS